MKNRQKQALTNHNTREHSEFGGSQADRAIACPGSVSLSRQVPPVPAGPDAERGTACHEVLAELLSAFLEFKEHGTAFDEDAILAKLEHDPRVEEERVDDCIEAVLGAIETIWIRILGQTLTGKVYGIEEKFTYSDKWEMFGSVDFWCCYIDDRGRRVVVIFDFKTGRNAVPVKGNAQLAFYGAAVRKFLRGNGKDLDLVRACIYQPNDFSSEDKFKECTITAKQLDNWDKKIENAVHQIYVAKKPRFKTGEHCRFCRAQHICKKYQKDLTKKTSLDLVDVKAELPAVDILPAEQRVKIALHKGKIETWLKAVYSSVLNDAIRGVKFEGAKVVLGQSRRRWIKDEQKIESTLLALGMTQDDIWNQKLKPFGPIEKQLGPGTLESLLEKPAGKPVLAPINDKRPEAPSGQELLDFDPEEE